MRSALLVVDVQNDYFPGGRMELEGAVPAGRRAAEAIAAFRAAGLDVVHVRHVSLHAGATFFLPGTEGAEIHPSVRPVPGELVVTKHFPNSFRETPLLEELRSRGVSRLAIAGMMTHMCVDATTRAAADAGFTCLVLSDACATRALAFEGRTVAAPDVQAAFLAALGAAYAKVVPATQGIADLTAPPAS